MGPVVATSFAVNVAPSAGILAGLVFLAIGLPSLAAMKSTEPPAEPANEEAPHPAVLRNRIVQSIVIPCALIGGFFGSIGITVVGFAEMDLSIEDNQVRIMKQALTNQGFDPEDIETEVERLKNYGDLESVAAKNHKVLVKKEAAKLQELEAKSAAELQQKAQVRNQYISNVQSILNDKVKAKEFDGIPINPKLATELQDFLLVDKWKTPTGETLTDFDRAILDLKRPIFPLK